MAASGVIKVSPSSEELGQLSLSLPSPHFFPGLAFDLLRKIGFGIFHKGAALGKSKLCQSKLFMTCV